ncbi:MAG: saccharopine dehydrogenase family protein [Bacteroidales bacterium]|nr:saccharopine dehydrogenase family protein [Bacteroidales bacterium]
MNKVLIIGAGGVGQVVAVKCALNSDIFHEIILASRTIEKCEKIKKYVEEKYKKDIIIDKVDADYSDNVVKIIEKYKPSFVINVALPYQDLSIMEACLKTGVSYMDTANYEPYDNPSYNYEAQWAFHEKYKERGITAILGCGFDPGTTQAFVAYAAKHHFDEIHYLDIVDCNAGTHGKPFATNFNPEVNLREITQNGKYYENGKLIETKPLEISRILTYPEIGPRKSYLIFHEELDSLVKNFPSLKRARFWMTFSDEYLTHLRVLQNIGMTSIKPVKYKGFDVVPLEFLKEILPRPAELGPNYKGFTSIGCRIRGIKDGKERTYYIYNNCSHEAAYQETGTQAIAYTTGVSAVTGVIMFFKGYWNKPGVWNVEQFDPDPYLEELAKQGLPWHELFDIDLEVD